MSKKRNFIEYFLIILFLDGFCNHIESIKLDDLLPFGTDNGDERLETGDDLSSQRIDLRNPFYFYGNPISYLYVNLNGIITLDRDLPPYRNDFVFPFPLKLIAPFYADVDTTTSGNVYYRETTDHSFLHTISKDIEESFPHNSPLYPSSVFIVTWDSVGRYHAQSDQINTFQAVIVSNERHTFVIFLYPENGIKWLVGDDKFGSSRVDAQVGFDNGDGKYYALPASGTPEVGRLSSVGNTPSGKSGFWIFKLTDHSIESPNGNPGTRLISDVPTHSFCAEASTHACHKDATCHDYYSGFCCHCNPPFIGNGIDCIPSSKTLRMKGTLTGLVNNQHLSLELHSIFVLFEGRSTTLISGVQSQTAKVLLKFSAITTIFGFIFAQTVDPEAINGFALTGASFNRTAEVQFSGSGNVLTITQRFTSTNGHFHVETNVEGNVPPLDRTDKVEVHIPKHEYKRVAPGVIKSRSQHQLIQSAQVHVATVDDTINFHECHANPLDLVESLQLTFTKSFANYKGNNIAFMQSATIGVQRVPEDPCDNANCDSNAMCQATDNTFQCTCRSGFYGNGNECYDVDECREQTHDCHYSARCINTLGSHSCQCREGFLGDGRHCQEEPQDLTSCKELRNCDSNADCVFNTHEMRHMCVCRRGFQGDGHICVYDGYVDDNDCSRNPNLCHPDASCNFNHNSGRYECTCRGGFHGDGRQCQSIDCGQDPRICHENARCERRHESFVCVCNPGFDGDGMHSCTIAVPGEHGEGELIYAQAMFIGKAGLRHSMSHGNGRLISYDLGQLAVAVDVDCSSNEVFWTDIMTKTIKTSKLDGSNSKVLISNLGSPEGVAIDWIARNLYWTDSGFDKIQVSKLDGSHIKTLFSKNLTNPRSIVVDPIRGLLFWSDWNRAFPKIERSNLDGTQRQVLFSEGLHLPNGLVLDYVNQFVCWGDAGKQVIECATYEGWNRRVIYSEAGHTFGLTYFDNIFYWTDWKNPSGIRNIHAHSGHPNEDVSVSHGSVGRLYGIAVARSSCHHGSNPCSYFNGGCRYLCFASLTGGSTCACPDNVSEEECQRSAHYH